MRGLEPSPPSVARGDLEDVWRVKFEVARARYETAKARCIKLLGAKLDGLIAQPEDELALARRQESEALAEYARILKLFTELTVHGRLPEEHLVNEPDGGRD